MASRQHIGSIGDSCDGSANLIDMVEAALRFAQRRELILGSAFANPAWNIILRVYLAALKQRELPLESLTDQADRSKLTERWLNALSQDGLVITTVANGISIVRLTAHAKASMDSLFASAQAGTAIS
jgi:hypothetical protein